MLKPYLPREANPARKSSSSTASNNGPRFHHRQRVRPAMRHILHVLIFSIIHIIFSAYIRLRQIYHALVDRALAVLYYHHRTPELIKRDVKGLSRVPKHLSVILDLPPEGGKKDGLETLLNDACELAAWSASAGVPMLSIYERTGKDNQENLHVYMHLTDSFFRHSEVVSATPASPNHEDLNLLLRRDITIETDHLPSIAQSSILQPPTFARAIHGQRRSLRKRRSSPLDDSPA